MRGGRREAAAFRLPRRPDVATVTSMSARVRSRLMRPGRGLPAAAFAVLSLLLVGTMWVVPYLVTNDGPEWIFATHADNHYGDPGTLYQEVFVPSFQYAEHGFSAIYDPLDAWLGWQRGLQVALSVTALFVAWGFVALVSALHPRRWPLGFLGFPLALSWHLYMGFWAFVVATGLGLFILALLVRASRAASSRVGWKLRVLVASLLLLQAMAHAFAAVLTGGAVLFVSVACTRRGRRWVEAGLVLLTGIPAACVLVTCALASTGAKDAAFQDRFFRLPWRVAASILPQTIAPGPYGRAVAVAVVVVAATFAAAMRLRRSDTDARDRGLILWAILLLIAAAVAPLHLPGWQCFSQRFVMLVVSVLPLEQLPDATQRLLPPALFVVASLWVGLSYPFHRRLMELCPDAIAGLLDSSVHMKGEVLGVALRMGERRGYDATNAEVPLMTPLFHMPAAYEAAHGGVPDRFFLSGRGLYPFELRPHVSGRARLNSEHYLPQIDSIEFRTNLDFRREVVGELASFGMFYDEVAVFGALPQDLEIWRDRGYAYDWSQGTAMIAHFEPCSIDVVTPGAAATLGAPVFDVRVGKLGLLSDVHVPSVEGGDGLAHFSLTPAPCGVVSLHVRWEPTHPGELRSCLNASVDGDLVANITRENHRIWCDAR